MPRLFVAVWPPDPVLDAVAGLDRPPIAGLRWTTRDQWHVTLRFLGPVEDAAPAALALRGLVEAGVAPVEAVLGAAVGRFGNRVLHVPVGGWNSSPTGCRGPPRRWAGRPRPGRSAAI